VFVGVGVVGGVGVAFVADVFVVVDVVVVVVIVVVVFVGWLASFAHEPRKVFDASVYDRCSVVDWSGRRDVF
jgi:hypothetical protein